MAKDRAKVRGSFNDEPEVHDIDLSDSDDDATWTPFRERQRQAAAGVPPEERDEDSDEDDDVETDEEIHVSQLGVARTSTSHSTAKRRKISASTTPLPLPTRLVPDGKEFSIGDFMVLKSDANRESAPIWRLDSKTLLQRFNAVQGSSGKWLHQSANLFTSYAASARDTYYSLAVRFIRYDKGDSTVQVTERGFDAASSVSAVLRKQSLEQTKAFQEPFEVYIQALISQCLDANFLQEVFQDKGTLFNTIT